LRVLHRRGVHAVQPPRDGRLPAGALRALPDVRPVAGRRHQLDRAEHLLHDLLPGGHRPDRDEAVRGGGLPRAVRHPAGAGEAPGLDAYLVGDAARALAPAHSALPLLPGTAVRRATFLRRRRGGLLQPPLHGRNGDPVPPQRPVVPLTGFTPPHAPTTSPADGRKAVRPRRFGKAYPWREYAPA